MMIITSDQYLEKRDYCIITDDVCENIYPYCNKCSIAIQRIIDDATEMHEYRTLFPKTLNGIEATSGNTVARAGTIEEVLEALPKTYKAKTPFRNYRWLEPTLIRNNWPALCYIQKEYHQYTAPLYYCYSHLETVLMAVYSDVAYLAAPCYEGGD